MKFSQSKNSRKRQSRKCTEINQICSKIYHDNQQPKPHIAIISKKRQKPTFEDTVHLSQSQIEEYQKFHKGLVLVGKSKEDPICLAKWLPFNKMPNDELQSWNEFAQFLIHRTTIVPEVKKNGAQAGGVMYADGWRKSYKTQEAFGRFCNVVKLQKHLKKGTFDWFEEEDNIQKSNDWLSKTLKSLAPLPFEESHNTLKTKNLPSLAMPEYGYQLRSSDFASFLTFTMYNFFNKPHVDTDINTWTLVGWIPIIDPLKNHKEKLNRKDVILADENFDMIGGQFVFRDFQFYLDFTKFSGISLCVFKSNEYRHQTLEGCSPSELYTRIGFSCQISQKLAHAVEKYLSGELDNLPVGGQLQHIIDAQSRK